VSETARTSGVRPKLLVLASTFPASLGDGVPAFVLDIAREEAVDFDVTVLTPRVRGAAEREVIDGVTVVRFGYFPKRWEDLADGAILDNLKARRSRWLQVLPLVGGQVRAIRRLVRELRPDAIHAHWVIPQGVTARLAAPGVPILVTTHGGDIYALNGGVAARIKQNILRRAHQVTTVNAEMAARLRDWGVDSERLSVLPMGVPLEDVLDARARATPVPGRITVVGRLVEKKGFGVLIEALRDLDTATPWSLHIVGDGPLRTSLEHQAAGLPITFLGQQSRSEVLREMGESEVFAVPSVSAASGDQEGLPVVLLEAAAMGCAIIASNLPGINEALSDGQTGLLVPQGDIAALGSGIRRLLEDEALRSRLSDAARQRGAEYSNATIGLRYRETVARVIAGKPGRRD
jgi:glycosyltransferase involved in cell wall biosynthesis